MRIFYKLPILVLFYFTIESHAQDSLTYRILGRIIDEKTEKGLEGINVIHFGEHKTNGTASDKNGYFIFSDAQLGTNYLQFSSVVYETKTIPIIVTSGKEEIITIKLQENYLELDAVEIIAKKAKNKTNNQFIATSGRSFNIEESNRYAGSLGDPARMVQNYAGVSPVRDDRNDIIIRGNSPVGNTWILNGVEVANPNHFGGQGLTGSTVTILNNNLLDNSDFLTGGFPAEYGNVTSGIFDVNMRQGNFNKKELWIQNGWNGIEIGAESPIHKSSKSSGLFVYRYSFLDLISQFGIDMGVLPKYQDLTYKMDINTNKIGRFSFFGIVGNSAIDLLESNNDTIKNQFGTDVHTSSNLTIMALTHEIAIRKKSNLFSTISYDQSTISTQIDTFHNLSDPLHLYFQEQASNSNLSFTTRYLTKIGTRSNLQIGTRISQLAYDAEEEVSMNGAMTTTIDQSINTLYRSNSYLQLQHYFGTKWNIQYGLHHMYFSQNSSNEIQGRFGTNFRINTKTNIGLSIGQYSRTLPLFIYFVEKNKVLTNANLDNIQSRDIVLSWKQKLFPNMRLKAELYYQMLGKVPIKLDHNNTDHYSYLNAGGDFFIQREADLVSLGKGQNYGLELTLEQFRIKGFYSLSTLTLFKSYSIDQNNNKRNTVFSNDYSVNQLIGYEIKLSQKHAIFLDLKLNWAGGNRYIPIDYKASNDAGYVMYDYNESYNVQHPGYFRTDLKITHQTNYKEIDTEFSVDLQNITDHKNLFRQNYNPISKTTRNFYHQRFFPMFTFKVHF